MVFVVSEYLIHVGIRAIFVKHLFNPQTFPQEGNSRNDQNRKSCKKKDKLKDEETSFSLVSLDDIEVGDLLGYFLVRVD